MPRFDLPADCTFQQLAARVAEYIVPFQQMWPFYWLKAAAVRDDETWRLCHFVLAGRWSDVVPIIPMRDQGEALVAVSHLLDAAQVMGMLNMLATEGRIPLTSDVVAQAPTITLSNTGYYWQESIEFISHDVKDVVEPAQWVYLYAGGSSQQWLTNFQVEEQIRNTIQPDLDKRGMQDFSQYLAIRFAQDHRSPTQFALNQFGYTIELPLALRVERSQRDTKSSQLELVAQCRKPLAVSDLRVTRGKYWSSDSQTVRADVEVESDSGWSFANFATPVDCDGVCITTSPLEKWLSYAIPTPSPEKQALDAVRFMYSKSATEPLSAGDGRWRDDLKKLDETKSGTRFEIAIANALARLGIPVLFGGQINQDGHMEGPATRGIDLVALDLKSRSAAAISLKYKPKAPSSDETEKLLNAVGELATHLVGWTTFGILACLAPTNHLSGFKYRTDIRVWSREDVEFISNADGADAVRYLLWLPPWVSIEQSWAYFSGYVGLVNNPFFKPI